MERWFFFIPVDAGEFLGTGEIDGQTHGEKTGLPGQHCFGTVGNGLSKLQAIFIISIISNMLCALELRLVFQANCLPKFHQINELPTAAVERNLAPETLAKFSTAHHNGSVNHYPHVQNLATD